MRRWKAARGWQRAKKRCAELVSIICISLWLGAAGAGEPDAAALFDEATAAFQAHQYARAAELFSRAHVQSPHPVTAFSSALAWDKAGDGPRAADGYVAALAIDSLDSSRRRSAQQHLRELERTLGVVSIPSPVGAKVKFEHVDGTLPVQAHATPGEHALSVTLASGTVIRRTLSLRAGERVVVEVPDESVLRATASSSATSAPVASVEVQAPKSTGEPVRELNPVAPVLAGAGLALAIASLVLFESSLNARDEFDASGQRDADARDRAIRWRAWEWVTAGGALVLGSSAALFWTRTPTVGGGDSSTIWLKVGGRF